MKRPFKRGVITCVALQNAVLCADCECISESRNDVCEVCGGRALVNLARLLGSAMQGETASLIDMPESLRRELEPLADSLSHDIHPVPRRTL
jgi:hypothetical protein